MRLVAVRGRGDRFADASVTEDTGGDPYDWRRDAISAREVRQQRYDAREAHYLLQAQACGTSDGDCPYADPYYQVTKCPHNLRKSPNADSHPL